MGRERGGDGGHREERKGAYIFRTLLRLSSPVARDAAAGYIVEIQTLRRGQQSQLDSVKG